MGKNSLASAMLCVGLCALLFNCPAKAEIPDAVRAMIETAMAEKDDKAVETVIGLASKTNPEDAEELAALHNNYKQQRAAEEAQKLEQRYAQNGLFDHWSGKGELGGFRSTGNTNNIGVTGALSLVKTSENWRHKVDGIVDFQRTGGVTTKEQYRFAYEPNVNISKRVFAYGLTQYERDRFQGFSARYSVSGGVGYKVLTGPDTLLEVQAGPAWRLTELVGGGTTENIAGLTSLDFLWNLSPTLKFTQAADAYVQSGNSTLTSTTGLEAKLSGNLSGRISYSVDYESNPPAGNVSTDTLSRLTLVYGF